MDFFLGDEDLSLRSEGIDIEEHTQATGFSQEFFRCRGWSRISSNFCRCFLEGWRRGASA